MNIAAMKNEIMEACNARDLNRAIAAASIAAAADNLIKDQPGYKEFQEVVIAAAIWIKTIADQIGHIGEIMNTLTKQSLEDGMYDYRVARTFMNEVDTLKASMKWDSIDPNFYMNADTVYMMVKPYVEAMEEGEA